MDAWLRGSNHKVCAHITIWNQVAYLGLVFMLVTCPLDSSGDNDNPTQI